MRTIERSRTRGGFTLTELMITAALIGTLAAIAVPNFLSYQARSRRSEAFSNLAGIARAFKVYHGERGRYPDMTADAVPAAASLPAPGPGQPSTTKMIWDAQTEAFFNLVGWRPDGNVFYSYEVESNCGVCPTQESCFTVVAHGNVDNKNGMGAVMYVHPMTDNAGNVTASCPSFLGYSTPVNPSTATAVYNEPAVYLGFPADRY